MPPRSTRADADRAADGADAGRRGVPIEVARTGLALNGTNSSSKTLVVMSNFQLLLRYVPEPSIKLFIGLAMVGLLITMSLTWLGAIG